jgi:uncharacterized protein
MDPELRLDVADLLHRPGARREVRFVTRALDGLTAGTTALDSGEPLVADMVVERVPDGVVVRGDVSGRWRAPCARCLTDVGGDLRCELSELFEPEPLEGETYLLDGDEIDLDPPLRDAVLLELPVAPHCRADCRGLCSVCGADRNTTDCDCDPEPPDPRWDALRELRLSR